MNLNTFYGVEDNKSNKSPLELYIMYSKQFLFIAGYYIIPLSVASFMGPVILGKYFDTVGRKKWF